MASRQPSARVHLVDASPYIFRAYFSLPSSLADGAGRPVNAVYGFAGFLLKLLETETPSHLGVAFDRSLTTSFRNEIYPDYKAQRELPPPELEAQLADAEEMARALGAATFADERFEADDLIATLTGSLVAAGHRVVVVSSDKDLAQLVGERVEMLDFARGERYDAAAVCARFSVRPEQIPDLLGLAGDPVDNIPGIAGVGPKSAAALLGAFPDLESVFAHLDRVPELPVRGAAALARRLQAGRETALLSKRLATASREAPAAAGLDELAWRGARRDAVERLFGRLGFARLGERIPRWREDGT